MYADRAPGDMNGKNLFAALSVTIEIVNCEPIRNYVV